MIKRSAATLVISLVTLKFFFSVPIAFSEEAKTDDGLGKYYRPTRCGAFSGTRYISGKYEKSDRIDRFSQRGLRLGMGCTYTKGRFFFGIDGELYLGKLEVYHEEKYLLKGSVSYVEWGVKERVSVGVGLHGVKTSISAGVQSTHTNGFEVGNVSVDLGNGWLNFTKFAVEHMTSEGQLFSWEAGINLHIPIIEQYLDFTFGVLWQNYNLVINVQLDEEGMNVLRVLDYNTSRVNREFAYGANFVNFSPGLRGCYGRFCTAVEVPWGIFMEKKWLWGFNLTTEFRM